MIHHLRAQRPAMVQHLSQFYFIHDSVASYLDSIGRAYEVEEDDVDDNDHLDRYHHYLAVHDHLSQFRAPGLTRLGSRIYIHRASHACVFLD